jgi:hypothetical protein
MPPVVVHDMVSRPVVAASKTGGWLARFCSPDCSRRRAAVIFDHPYNVE